MDGRWFAIGSATALVGWALLVFVPRWRGVAQAVATVAVPAILSAAYAALVGAWWSRGAGGFGSLDGVRSLFETPGLLVAGWLHYLAFDLLVGAWAARDAYRRGVPHAVVVPILILTFVFGPVGYLASLAVGAARRVAGVGAEGRAGEGRVVRAVRAWVRREPTLVAASFVCLAAMVPTGFACLVDDRTFEGFNVWIKPLKFEASVGIYLATLGFFMPLARAGFRRSPAGRYVVWASIIMGAFEVLYIGWRASRGEASHFNKASTSAAVLYALMGVAALVLAAAGPVLAWGIARSEGAGVRPSYRLGVILGLVLTFILGAVGGAVMSAGTGHHVGTPAAGDPGLPLIGWSRSVGDLRVAHFLGLHAQQAVALAGGLAAARLGRWGRPTVVAFAACYAVAALGLFLQALAGRPFLPF